jgi:uncharacterized membrane protein YheB (UPF0754 family)
MEQGIERTTNGTRSVLLDSQTRSALRGWLNDLRSDEAETRQRTFNELEEAEERGDVDEIVGELLTQAYVDWLDTDDRLVS